jgi:alkylation response protein AidB-like acyl-CoA dehydrogenase
MEVADDRGNLVREFGWIREAGLLAVVLPKTEGGLGWGSEPGTWALLLRLLKIIGRGNLSVGRIFEGHVNALQLVLQWGTAEQIRAASQDIRQGCLFGVWNTEAPGDGVSLHRIPGRKCLRLQGAKTFASGASLISRVFVNAIGPDGGWQMCLVPLDSVCVKKDANSWNPIGMQGSDSIRVDFTDVEVRPEALLGKPNDYTLEPWFSGGAIRFAAVQLGGAEAVAEAARAFLRELGREDNPHQAMRAGEIAALVETGNLWLDGAGRIAEQAGAHPEELIAYAGLMRRTMERIGLEVMELAVRSAGARALMKSRPLERLVRDLTMYLRQPAPDEVLVKAGLFAAQSAKHFDELWR